ncbi:MAG TPA: hydroxyacid dehydrogenase [Stellaceae bacterium]|nr:hydroxyacid dehydrogenase [Stellaceae bacterium]
MSKPVIVILDQMHEDGATRAAEDAEVIEIYGPDKAKADNALGRADAILVRSTIVGDALLAKAPHLKAVGKHGSGVDNIDIPALTRRGVALANTPGLANATAVSEGAVTLMLAVLKLTFDVHQAVLDGEFKIRVSLRVGDMWKRTVGIIGLGNIGTHVARICGLGFNMRVLAYDPYVTAEQMTEKGAEKVDALPDLLAQSDIVTLHCPLTPETHHMIAAAEFAMMKPSAILVNASRGSTVDENALIDALKSGQIAGAGVDVFEEEPPTKATSPLLSLTGTNLVLSPHMAGLTNESTSQMAIRSVEVVLDILNGRRPSTLLNPEVWETHFAGAASA